MARPEIGAAEEALLYDFVLGRRKFLEKISIKVDYFLLFIWRGAIVIAVARHIEPSREVRGQPYTKCNVDHPLLLKLLDFVLPAKLDRTRGLNGSAENFAITAPFEDGVESASLAHHVINVGIKP